MFHPRITCFVEFSWLSSLPVLLFLCFLVVISVLCVNMDIWGWSGSLFHYMSASAAGLFLMGGLPVGSRALDRCLDLPASPKSRNLGGTSPPLLLPSGFTLDEVTLAHQHPHHRTGCSRERVHSLELFCVNLFGGRGRQIPLLPMDVQ